MLLMEKLMKEEILMILTMIHMWVVHTRQRCTQKYMISIQPFQTQRSMLQLRDTNTQMIHMPQFIIFPFQDLTEIWDQLDQTALQATQDQKDPMDMMDQQDQMVREDQEEIRDQLVRKEIEE